MAKAISIPSEERARCPRCKRPAAVIDRTKDKVTTACVNCGRTIGKHLV